MEIRRVVHQKELLGPPPKQLSPNRVIFSTGEEITIGFETVQIAREGKMLTLKVLTDSDLYSKEQGFLREVIWGLSPKWSDGELSTQEEISELAGKLHVAAKVMNHLVDQFFY